MSTALTEQEVRACMYIIQHGTKARAAKTLNVPVEAISKLLRSAQAKLGVTIFSFRPGKMSAMVARCGYTKLRTHQVDHGGFWLAVWDGHLGFLNTVGRDTVLRGRSVYSRPSSSIATKG